MLRKLNCHGLRLTCQLMSSIAGLVASVDAPTDNTRVGWIRLYNLTFIVGLAIGFLVFLCLSRAFPPSSLGLEADFSDKEVCKDTCDVSSDGTGRRNQNEKSQLAVV